MKRWTLASTLLALGTLSAEAYGQTRSQVYGSPLDQQAQTVYVRGDAGMSTYESDAAGSKETKESTVMTLGGWAGEARTVGASITSSQSDVSYALNDSRTRTAFNDVRVAARIWWLTPSVGVSLSEVEVERDGAKTVNLYGTGLNAGMGIQIPAYRTIVLYGDAMVSKANRVFDKISDTTKLGDRMEGDAGVSFDVTDRMVDLLVGYRIRQYDIETPSVKHQEKAQGAYAGLRVGLYF